MLGCKVRLYCLPHPITEPLYRYRMTNNLWQEFQSVVQTMLWEEAARGISDEKIAEIDADIKEIRELLDES